MIDTPFHNSNETEQPFFYEVKFNKADMAQAYALGQLVVKAKGCGFPWP